VGCSCGRVDDSLFSGLLTGGVLRLPFPVPLVPPSPRRPPPRRPPLCPPPPSASLPRPFSSVPLVALRGYVRHTQNSPWSTPGDGISKYRPFRIYPRVTRYAYMRTHTYSRTHARTHARARVRVRTYALARTYARALPETDSDRANDVADVVAFLFSPAVEYQRAGDAAEPPSGRRRGSLLACARAPSRRALRSAPREPRG